jgi:hypothetical protein
MPQHSNIQHKYKLSIHILNAGRHGATHPISTTIKNITLSIIATQYSYAECHPC